MLRDVYCNASSGCYVTGWRFRNYPAQRVDSKGFFNFYYDYYYTSRFFSQCFQRTSTPMSYIYYLSKRIYIHLVRDPKNHVGSGVVQQKKVIYTKKSLDICLVTLESKT